MDRSPEPREEDVLRILESGRSLEEGSGPWTVRFIRQASRQFGPRWQRLNLTGLDAVRVILPPHAGEPCHGDRVSLVPAEGASVAETARRLESMQVEYARDNPMCWSRIARAMEEPLSPIILTRAPLDDDQYRALRSAPGSLYHLDGFHRLVAWALAGRLDRQTRVVALVAG